MAEYGRCELCVSWTLRPEADNRCPVGFGECASPKWQRGYNVRPDEFALDDVLVEDDEGWGVYTGPQFGCIHFQLKDADG